MSNHTESRSTPTAPDDPLLEVDGLRTRIHTGDTTIDAVDGVSFAIDRGETVCLVGESGSGKSVTCESLTGIVPQPPAEIVAGTVTFDGIDLLEADERTRRRVRGRRISHVFQNPQQALDPVFTVGDQITEAITIHEDVSTAVARERAIELLHEVGIPRPASRIDEYPHEFSGGMRQRVAIAIALAGDPELIIADEPTTAVDVTVQARLIELIRDLTDEGTSILLITHDLRVVSSVADRVLVMYGGTIVERGPLEAIFEQPAHPYTQDLFDSYDTLAANDDRSARGDIPSDGCRFRAECPHAVSDCAGGSQPPFYDVSGTVDHAASCVHYGPAGAPEVVLEDAEAVRSLSEVNR